MPPSMFNEMGRDIHWDALTEARAMYQESTATATSSSGATWLLVGGAAVLAMIVIAMALLVG